MKRLGIYLFYDKDGIVDDYIPYFLECFKPFLAELCIVVNGKLTEESKKKIEPFCDKILLRENTGFDAWAYKYTLEYYGYDKLQTFDEVILCNYTFFGPFYPLENLFSDMDKKKCDWWGLYRWYEQTPIDYQHIPSYWVSYRRSLISSPDFKAYWDTLQPICSYDDSVLYHEQRQALYYDQKGYQCATWIDHMLYQEHWEKSWPLTLAHRVVMENHFPFVKRRNFFIEGNGTILFPQVPVTLIPFLRQNTDYDIRLIWDNIQRTQSPERFNRSHYSISTLLRFFRYWLGSKLYLSANRRYRYKQKYLALFFSKEGLYNQLNHLFCDPIKK